jgi:hypothetical protein
MMKIHSGLSLVTIRKVDSRRSSFAVALFMAVVAIVALWPAYAQAADGGGCNGADYGTCSPTRGALIARGGDACLQCAIAGGAIDDPTSGVSNANCEDLASPSDQALCASILRCELGVTQEGPPAALVASPAADPSEYPLGTFNPPLDSTTGGPTAAFCGIHDLGEAIVKCSPPQGACTALMSQGLTGISSPTYQNLPGATNTPTGRADAIIVGLSLGDCGSTCLSLASTPAAPTTPAMPEWLVVALAAVLLGVGANMSSRRRTV